MHLKKELLGQLTELDDPCRHFHGSSTPFTLLYLSAALHLPFSICCSLFVGVSEEARNLWRGLDIFFIFTCAGAKQASISLMSYDMAASCACLLVMLEFRLARRKDETCSEGNVKVLGGISS